MNSKDLRLDGRVVREKRSLFQQVCFDQDHLGIRVRECD